MRRAIFVALLLAAGPAMAQPQPQPDPLEVNLVQQWQAAQTGQANVGAAIDKIIRARKEAMSDVAKARVELDEVKKRCGAPCKGIGDLGAQGESPK